MRYDLFSIVFEVKECAREGEAIRVAKKTLERVDEAIRMVCVCVKRREPIRTRRHSILKCAHSGMNE